MCGALIQLNCMPLPNFAESESKVLPSTLFFILVEDTHSKDSVDEKVQTEMVNIDPAGVSKHKLTGTPDSKVLL